MSLAGAGFLVCAMPSQGVKLEKLGDAPAAATDDQGPDPCACIQWQDAYKVLDPKHYGYEDTIPDVGDLRTKFFFNQHHNFCVKVEFTQAPEKVPYPGNWCYVDAKKCKDLNGGKTVNEFVSAKKCRYGVDFSLSELPPPFLLQNTNFIKDSYPIAMLMAYPWHGPAAGQGPMMDMLNATNEDGRFKTVMGLRLNLLAKTSTGAWGFVGNAEREGTLAVYGGNEGSYQHWEVQDTWMECAVGNCVEKKEEQHEEKKE